MGRRNTGVVAENGTEPCDEMYMPGTAHVDIWNMDKLRDKRKSMRMQQAHAAKR